jgi:superfamily II DNA or RNA helicase/HKD family nuclease
MNNFIDLHKTLEKSFINTGPNSFSTAFLIPSLKISKNYKRSVGYFTSGAVIHLLEGLEGLVSNKGKIKIICSPQLSEDDIEAIQQGQKNKEELVNNNFYSTLVIGMRQVSNDKSRLLIYLIENGILEFKLALSETFGIYHDKLGIVEDLEGNKVCFVGSLNETLQAYTRNYEKVRLFYSWKNNDDAERIKEEEDYFDRLWANKVDYLRVENLSPEIVEKVVRLKPEFEWDNDLDLKESTTFEVVSETNKDPIKLRPYQLEAISSWKKNEFHGILSMATGTGKTFTAIQALKDVIDIQKGDSLFVYIVVPYQVLLNQWKRELARFGIDSEEARGASGNRIITNAGRMLRYKAASYKVIITTSASFDSSNYADLINGFEFNIFFLADEVHNLGTSSKLSRIPSSKYKLGLSATPQRHFDDFGTNKLLEKFKGIVYEFDLERAISEGFLVPYNYHPIYTNLTLDEQTEYDDLTIQIVRALQIKDEREVYSQRLNPIAERLLIKRARIILGAIEKIERFYEVYKRFDHGQMNLVYCGAASHHDEETDLSIRQIDQVTDVFFKNDIKSIRYTSDENEGLREDGMSLFVNPNNNINTIVAIKCLDEGLDIPQVENAFILGSTTNDKEFIQRRGRVLRKYKDKEKAEIIDFVVMPHSASDKGLGVVLREMNRVYEYNRYAMNRLENEPKILQILNDYDVNMEDIAGE